MTFIPRRAVALALSAVAVIGAAACSDSATAPRDVAPSPSIAMPGRQLQSLLGILGDTSVSTFTLNGNGGTWVITAGEHRIIFENGLSSVCNPATSTYGPGEWDQPCTPATSPITITAKVWKTLDGRSQIDFSPALRFVPTSKVTLQMYDRSATGSLLGAHINYCPTVGLNVVCVREALLDASLRSYVTTSGFINRRIKHFSGYIVALGRECEEGDEMLYPECILGDM
jgi:hypothetical protein